MNKQALTNLVKKKMTREGLARALEKSPNTIKGHIVKLKAEGELNRMGSDRNEYWETKNK